MAGTAGVPPALPPLVAGDRVQQVAMPSCRGRYLRTETHPHCPTDRCAVVRWDTHVVDSCIAASSLAVEQGGPR